MTDQSLSELVAETAELINVEQGASRVAKSPPTSQLKEATLTPRSGLNGGPRNRADISVARTIVGENVPLTVVSSTHVLV